VFVPIARSEDASPHAQELGRRLGAIIREYRERHPDVSTFDVRTALHIAAAGEARGDRRLRLLIAIIVAVLLMGVLVAFMIGVER